MGTRSDKYNLDIEYIICPKVCRVEWWNAAEFLVIRWLLGEGGIEEVHKTKQGVQWRLNVVHLVYRRDRVEAGIFWLGFKEIQTAVVLVSVQWRQVKERKRVDWIDNVQEAPYPSLDDDNLR